MGAKLHFVKLVQVSNFLIEKTKIHKLKFFFICLIVSSLSTSACDLCGCANGSSFVGLLPRSGSQFVGMRYRLRSFDSHLNSQMLKTKEEYNTLEVWGRFYPIKKLQVLAFLPYNDNQQTMLYS